MHWERHGARVKLNHNPLSKSDEAGALRNRRTVVMKLTHSEQVDTCPCLAFTWLVWAIVCGAFGVHLWCLLLVDLHIICLRSHRDIACLQFDMLVWCILR
jgi:hypothetical protein